MKKMKLRKLEMKDAPLMLEWMHDKSVVKDLRTEFTNKTLSDCVDFIKRSLNDTNNVHLAIVDDADEYMGTVSLKHIEDYKAEFGITVRACAMGKGFSHYAMQYIMKYGFTHLNLKYIYWCVDPINRRAVRFYEKNGYVQQPSVSQCAKGYTEEEKEKYLWYLVSVNELERYICN